MPDSIRRQQQQLLEIGGNDDVCRRGSLCCRSLVGWMDGWKPVVGALYSVKVGGRQNEELQSG